MDVSEHKISENFVVRRKGGESIIEHPPVFSLDSTTVFIVCGQTIRAYSVQTGEFLRNYEGLGSKAIGVQLNPINPDLLVACSDQGEFLEWDWKKKLLSRKINLKYNPGKYGITGFHLFASSKFNKTKALTLIGLFSTLNEKNLTVYAFCTSTGNRKGEEYLRFSLKNDKHSYAFGGRSQQEFMAGINDNMLYVAMLGDEQTDGVHSIMAPHELTCVTCHPNRLWVLAGDILGCIRLWRGIFNNASAVCDEYHWHTLPVVDVAFSHIGINFYSGGVEGVLVKWSVDAPNLKKYLPRLSAPVKHLVIASENLVIAISTVDNAIQLVDSSFKLTHIIQHFSWSAEYVELNLPPFPAGLAVDPRTKALVLNGRTGHIQFFSLQQKTLLYQLNITGQNYLTQEREKVIINTDVIRLALSSSGHWMATVEHRDDNESSPELRLKFWEYSDVKQTYTLNTSIENPHKTMVYAIEFQPTHDSNQLLAVTTGDDLKFRIWSLVESSSIYKKGQVWKSESVGFFRNLPAHALSFSTDSSLLAVTFGPTLTVWVPETNELKCSLTRSEVRQDLSHVEFGRRDCLHLVVTGTSAGLAVWNLLSLSLVWTVQLSLSLLVSDHASCLMAAVTTNNDLMLFSPMKPEPVHKQVSIIPSGINIQSAVFVQCSNIAKGQQNRSQLYFVDSSWRLSALEWAEDKEVTKEDAALDILPTESQRPLTAFGALVAKQIISDTQELKGEKHRQLGIPGAKSIENLLVAPAHTSAPISLLCGSVLLSLVASAKGPKVGNDIMNEEDNDSGIVSSDKDEPLVLGSRFEQRKQQPVPRRRTTDLEELLSSVLHERLDWTPALSTQT